MFLLSSPQFLGAGCDSIDVVKEQVFRKYDIDPLDGKLSHGELAEAFQKHDVDLSYLDHLNEIEYFDDTKGGVMLSDVMNSNTASGSLHPRRCKFRCLYPRNFLSQSRDGEERVRIEQRKSEDWLGLSVQ